MPSRMINKPWEYLLEQKSVIDLDKMGVHAIYCWDSFIEKILIYHIKSNLKKRNGPILKTLIGQELSKSWIEDNLNTLSLFGGDESYLVINADEMNQEAQETLINLSSNIDNRYVLLFFNKKTNAILSEVENVLIFDRPPFWEERRLLDFISSEMRLTLAPDLLNYIFETVGAEVSSYVVALNLIRLNLASGQKIDRARLQELLTVSKLDQFVLIEYLNQKDWLNFYSYLMQTPIDGSEGAKLFSFIVGHLLKLRDPSYVTKKKRPSKYDLRIEQISRAWSEDEIDKLIRIFGELATISRSGAEVLNKKIRLLYLEHIFQ